MDLSYKEGKKGKLFLLHKSIFQCNLLRELDLSDNDFAVLPHNLSDFKHLKELKGFQFFYFISFFYFIFHLSFILFLIYLIIVLFIIFIFIFNFYFIIQVQGNPLNSIPNEMISLDNFDLFKWIKNFPKENNLMNYFHLVVVGDEKSGKSRLISSLVGNDYKQKQDNETMGIILNDWTYQQKENSTSFFSVKINFLFFIYF